ncbi:hypoxia-inducible factor 1-alpha inhibitor-like [Oscarella lobularis]|uniref:hypoxia-inducible factor 1-alpha inhibitor-like n=1 Tax=Oscarella lobularis TaxID=121494 RepID=UPI0033143DEB
MAAAAAAREDETASYMQQFDGRLNKYDFHLEEIPRLSHKDRRAEALIAAEKPVVLTGTSLVKTALKWSLPYLEANLGSGDCNVYESKTNRFKYYDDKKLTSTPDFKFVPPTHLRQMTFSEFVTELRQCEKNPKRKKRVYLQQPLNDTVGPAIVRDFVHFDWEWLRENQSRCNWGPLTSNLLLVGMAGNLTPAHYDEQQNFFCQVEGQKHCMLFAPDQFENMYPYPIGHPCDRQSQLVLEEPIDSNVFPNVSKLRGVHTVVGPGDVLYIPMYWWHQIQSLADGEHTTSVTFWYRAGPSPKEIKWPLSVEQKVAVTRNIEKMLHEALKDPNEVRHVLRMIVDGRYSATNWKTPYEGMEKPV